MHSSPYTCRVRKGLILALLILLSTSQSVYAAKVIPGSTCKKLNNQEVYKGKIYTCIKLGKKLYWNNGVKHTKKTTTPTLIPTATPSPTPSPSNSPCKTTLSAPVITVTPTALGYSVSFTQAENPNFGYIQIFEAISNDDTAPKSGFQEVSISSSNPDIVTIGLKIDKRWVIARLLDKNCGMTSFSNAVPVKPFDPVEDAIDMTPPNEVTITSAGWVGNDIQIAYIIPTTDGGKDFQIFLTNGTRTRSTSEFPIGSNTSQTARITGATLEALFGSDYPTSFTGLFKSIDKSRNVSAGVIFTISQKPNSLGGGIP
jgi:hypothetical protein